MDTENLDPELDAMQKISKAITVLDEEAKRRVLAWALDKFGIEPAKGKSKATYQFSSEGEGETDINQEYQELENLFFDTQPSTHPDRVLVTCYWLQYIKKKPDIKSQYVNSQLKQLGHNVGNITKVFNSLVARKPQPLQQIRKSGSTQQARKKFRMTAEGKKNVEAMISTRPE